MDATVARGLLVPAFMRLAGDANWWAPGRATRGGGGRCAIAQARTRNGNGH